MKRFFLLVWIMNLAIADAQQLNLVKDFETFFDKTKNKTSFKYDALSEIMQIGLNKGILTGNEKDVSLKATLYGLMVLGNKDYEIDRSYSKLTFQRNLEFAANMKINDDEKINGFGLAIKYAIINKRDLSVNDAYTALHPKIAALSQSLHESIAPIILSLLRTKTGEDKARLNRFIQENSNIKNFPIFFNELRRLMLFPDSLLNTKMSTMQNALDDLHSEYYTITRGIEKGPLLTFSGESVNTNNTWDLVKLKLEYIKGLGFVKDDQNPWDIYVGAYYAMLKDSLSVLNRLTRITGSVKGGINHVLVKDASNQSLVEILGGLEYNSIFHGAYVNEKTNQMNMLFNLAFRIAPNLYLPLEIKYDPDKANFQGLVRLKWDMLRGSSR